MTSDKCLEALAWDVWESNWKNIFKSAEWKEHKKSCAAEEKRLVVEEKEKEREREKEQKDMERWEKAQEKEQIWQEKAKAQEQQKVLRDAEKAAKAAI